MGCWLRGQLLKCLCKEYYTSFSRVFEPIPFSMWTLSFSHPFIPRVEISGKICLGSGVTDEEQTGPGFMAQGEY